MSVNYKKLWKLMIDKNLSKTELTHLAGKAGAQRRCSGECAGKALHLTGLQAGRHCRI